MHSIHIVKYGQAIENAVENAKSVDIAVAFATEQGLNFGNIKQKLVKLLKKGGALRVIVDLRLAHTTPEFLADLFELKSKGFKVECRSHIPEANGIFHPKVYIFRLYDGSSRVISGSANWTEQAYTNNIEYGFIINGDQQDAIIKAAQKFFNDLWNSLNAKRIDSNSLNLYRHYWQHRHGLDREAQKRSASNWRDLQKHLDSLQPATNFKWPRNDTALLLGCLTARGSIEGKTLFIHFRYGGGAYSHNRHKGYIGKGKISYKAAQVVHLVPEAVAHRISKVVFPAIPKIDKIGKWTYKIAINCVKSPQILKELNRFFGNDTDYHSFHVPPQIFKAQRRYKVEFMRGYALACGLVSEGTYDPTYKHQVWLRPTTDNTKQFDEIVGILQKQLGIQATVHRRTDRDVAVKMRCESWLDIGFKVAWLDTIVEEGARLNGASIP